VPLAADRLVAQAITDRAFPAAVIETGTGEGMASRRAFGHLTYEEGVPPTREDTIFDLASLTKVIATTAIAMRAVDEGRIALDERVAARLPHWRGQDREDVTIADLLEHASGLTAYLPFFRDHQGRAEFERAICTMALEYAPRTQSIYSDLGFILLAFILEDAFRAPFAEVFDSVLGGALHQSCLLFNPRRELRDRCAPTELDIWRGRLLQGEVHDENCWALGGVAGHSGLFGTAEAVGMFAREILKSLRDDTHEPRDSRVASPEMIARFARKSIVPGSSRALGWDTMLPTSSCGTRMSPRAIGHTGFTGTSLWIDPERDRYVVMLTNRVHPSRDNHLIQAVRRAVHDAILESGIGDEGSGN
jgi:CubicO group peptidase (beta-lactamase class C family)